MVRTVNSEQFCNSIARFDPLLALLRTKRLSSSFGNEAEQMDHARETAHNWKMIVSTGFLLGIFFRGGGKIYCYANFFCYAIVFGPNFREGQKFSGGQTASGGRPLPPLWKNARVMHYFT